MFVDRTFFKNRTSDYTDPARDPRGWSHHKAKLRAEFTACKSSIDRELASLWIRSATLILTSDNLAIVAGMFAICVFDVDILARRAKNGSSVAAGVAEQKGHAAVKVLGVLKARPTASTFPPNPGMEIEMKKRLVCTTLLAAIGLPALAMAQNAPAGAPGSMQPTEAMGAAPASPNTGALHFGADLNLTTSYFYRGYNQEDVGLIFQPNVYGYTDIITADKNATLSGLQAKVGLWNSLQSEQTASDGVWYEADLYGSLTATFMNQYYATVQYTWYSYPEDAFENIHELGVAAGITDVTNFWDKSENKMFTLPVEYGVYWELEDGNGDEDIYTELKVTPTFAFGDEWVPSFGKPKLEIPIVLGGSFDGYYIDDDGHNDTIGYLSAGAKLTLPMNFIPEKYGTWNLVGGVNYIWCISDSTEAANDGGEDYEVQGTIGVSMTY